MLYSDSRVIAEYDGQYALLNRYHTGKGMVANANGLHYFHQNSHGDVSTITNAEGHVVEKYSYSAFGELTSTNHRLDNRFLYSGEQLDPLTGDYYLRARMYRPSIGRFLAEDVYRGDGMNLYAYVSNNPLIYVDPSGWGKEKWIPDIMQLDGTSDAEKYLAKRLKKFNKVSWDQNKVDELWKATDIIKNQYGIQIDPRYLLSIIIHEGTGSFNTSSANKPADGQNGVEKDYAKDLMKANRLIFGKILGYIYYGEDFRETVQMNQDKPGISGEGNLFQYTNWNTTIVNVSKSRTYDGVYAGHGSWHEGVSSIYEKLSYDGASEDYSKYVSSFGKDVVNDIAPDINMPDKSFKAKQNAQNYKGEYNGEYTIIGY